jgi:hypothetical protein
MFLIKKCKFDVILVKKCKFYKIFDKEEVGSNTKSKSAQASLGIEKRRRNLCFSSG